MDAKDLTAIGLTRGEVKIYNALLDLGETTRTALAKKSGISPSKIYDVANRLLEKGIISSVKKNGVLHFAAASPERLRSFLEQKEREIAKERTLVDQLIPQLLLKYQSTSEQADVEVLYGWEGMATAFDGIVNALEPGEWNYIFGASQGYDPKQADLFFSQYYQKKRRKGFGTKIIFNENVRKNTVRTSFLKEKPNEVRFLHQDTFAELNIYKDTVLFIMLLKKPIVIRITSKDAASSCRDFFETLWKQAKR